MEGIDSWEAFGGWLRQLRWDMKMKQVVLARNLGIGQPKVSGAEKGMVSPDTADRYDRYFTARGVIARGEIADTRSRLAGRLPQEPREPHQYADVAALARAGGGVVVVMPLPGAPELSELLSGISGGRTLDLPTGSYRVITASVGEVADTHRRELFQAAGGVALGDMLDRADKTYEVLTASIPDPWTLDELAEDAVTVAARYWSTPLDRLLPEVLDRYRQLADMLDRRPVGPDGQRVVQLAGTYAYYAARIGRHTGDRVLAFKFGRIAARCAEISGDPLLVGSVAGLRSCGAFDNARYAEAANIAGQVARLAHPYTRARLFAYQAHALAVGGHPDEARDALAEMRKHMVDLPPMPGAALFDETIEALFSAMVLADIGDRGAETFAREAIAGMPADDYHDAHANAWVTVGKSLADRDPGAAADAGLRALDINRVWPEVFVEARVRQLYRDLSRGHGKVAEVVQLGDAVRELPARRSV